MEKKLQLDNVVCVDYQCFLGSPTRYHNTRIIIVLHAHFAVGLDVPLLLTLRNPNRPPPVVLTILHNMPLQVSLKEYPNFYFPHKNPSPNDKPHMASDGREGKGGGLFVWVYCLNYKASHLDCLINSPFKCNLVIAG